MFFRFPVDYILPRQVVYTAVMSASEVALSHLADYLAEVKVESIKGDKANEIREEVSDSIKKFLGAKAELMNEIKALEVNPDKNKELLGELKKALAKSEETAIRCKVLLDIISSSDEAVINAVKSGHLAKTAREVAALVGKTKKIVEGSHATLGSLGAEKAGIVEINEIKPLEGKMKFYMYDYVPGRGVEEVEIKKGSHIHVSSFPICIRACVEDDMKIRFANLKDSGTLPAGTYFNDTFDASKGHKFSYTNDVIGTTEWEAKEEYTWEPDYVIATNEKLNRLSQRNSDKSTEASKGDIVEIWTGVPAQKLGFIVEGKTIAWKRRSVLHGKEKLSQEVPGNNIARAYINISIFSA